jgi:multidrug efflux pump subunit AcrB
VRYSLFAPVAADIIYGMLDFDAQRKRVEAISSLSNENTQFESMRSLSNEQVEEILKDAFAAADLDGNGTLDEDEMRIVLDSVGVTALGLTEKQITGICAAADLDGDGGVDYDELSTLVYDVVTQMTMEDAVSKILLALYCVRRVPLGSRFPMSCEEFLTILIHTRN